MDSFDVVTLGAPGAGTTMFLAAMFSQLKAGQPADGPFLDISLAQARMLQRMPSAAADPEAGWPQADPPAWEFTCCTRAAGRVFEIFRINYLDFAGVRLRQALFGNTAIGHRFQQKILSAHALLGVLDGLALRYLLDDDPRGERRDGLGMKTVFQIMRTHAGHRPVHFVVSKWDLLADAYGLGDVRAKLMEFGDFAALVRSGGPGRPAPLVRLIPVGALGSGFARLDAAGIVRPARAGVSSPVNAEIPLVALPVDFYHARAAGPVLSEDLMGGLADVLTPAAPWDGTAGVVDQRSAGRETILNFRRRLEQFEERYPASRPDSQPAEHG